MSDPTQPPPALTSDWKEATEAAEAWWITDEEGRNHAIYCYRAGYLSAKRKADHDAKPSSASWSTTPPTGPGYFWSRSHGGTPVIAWHTDTGIRMSCDQTVIVLDSDEGRDWMATQEIEFWPEPIVFAPVGGVRMNDEIHPAIARDAAQALPSASVRVKTGDVVRFRSGGRHKHGLVMQVTENNLLVYSKRNGGMHSVRPEDVRRIL